MIQQKDIEHWYSSAHYRKKSDWICIDQPKVIQEWQSSQKIGQIIHSDQFKPPKWMNNYPAVIVPHQWIKKITNKPSHKGCIAIIKRPDYPLSGLVESKRVVVLDGIQDPGNLGTMIRSMVAFGAQTLCLTNKCVDPFHPKSVTASAGTIAGINIFFEHHWRSWIEQSTLPAFILDPYSIHSLQTKKDQESFMLVCGSEGQGIQSDWINNLKKATPVSIPMSDHCESLNAAMSINIALFHFFTNH